PPPRPTLGDSSCHPFTLSPCHLVTLRGSPMATMLIPLMVFVGVAAAVGLLAFVFREQGPQTSTRLDLLVGKRSRADAQANDILRKTAFENDKKSLLEAITPKFL